MKKIKKTTINKITKCLKDTSIKYETDQNDIYFDNFRLNKSKSSTCSAYNNIKNVLGTDSTYESVVECLIEYCKQLGLTYSKKAEKEKEKEQKRLQKEAEKEAERINKTKSKYSDSDDWHAQLNIDSNGNVKANNIENYLLFFNNDERYKGKFKYDEFSQVETYNEKEIQDFDINYFCRDIEAEFGTSYKSTVETAVSICTHDNSYHSIKKIIQGLVWDGTERLEDFFIKYIGVDDTNLNRKLSKNWFYGLIKRIYEPGCDFDYMLIVQDTTGGTGKSKIIERLINVLGVGYGYDSTITADSTNKDNVDKLAKAICVSFEELADFDKKELPEIKAFISRNSETSRLAYARRSTTFSRHCVFYGNSNFRYCLNDYSSIYTSERRFWFMEAHGQRHSKEWWDENLTKDTLLQIWAEMLYMYMSNKNYDVTLNIDESEELRKVQNRHKKIFYNDIIIDEIQNLVNTKYFFNNGKDFFETYTEFDESVTKFDANPQFLGSFEAKNACFLGKIYAKWLKKWVKNTQKIEITTDKLSFILQDFFEYHENTEEGMCSDYYKRINEPSIITPKIEEKINELPF